MASGYLRRATASKNGWTLCCDEKRHPARVCAFNDEASFAVTPYLIRGPSEKSRMDSRVVARE
jgi:hypothetical protein